MVVDDDSAEDDDSRGLLYDSVDDMEDAGDAGKGRASDCGEVIGATWVMMKRVGVYNDNDILYRYMYVSTSGYVVVL